MREILAAPALLSREHVESALSLEGLIPAIEEGFRAYHAGRAVVSPVTSLHLPEVNGETHIRAGYMHDGDIVCVKVANFYFDNPARGLPTKDCVVVVSSRTTGQVRALLCDGGLLSDMRTAAASAVAVKHLARPGATTLGFVGAGAQAYWHARAFPYVRRITELCVWSRSLERAREMATRVSRETGIPGAAVSLEEAASADIVVTATPARQAVLDGQSLVAGTLVVAMGADTPGKRELGPGIFARASLVVADSLTQCRRAGELQWLPEPPASLRVEELGAILTGAAEGRRSENEIIVFDSTGIAFQDVVAASALLRSLPE